MGHAEKEDESIPLVDKLEPMLRGEKPHQRAATLFCFSILSSIAVGFMVATILNLDPEQPSIMFKMILLTIMLLILVAIDAISTVSFMKMFKQLTLSPYSTKESQKADSPSQHKAAQHSPDLQSKDTASKPHTTTPSVDEVQGPL